MTKNTGKVRSLQEAAAVHFNWFRNKIFSDVWIDGGIADLVFVTKAGYLTEVEIKCTVGDLKRDCRKKKWKRRRNHVKKFYYLVPDDIADRCLKWAPEGVGLLAVDLETCRVCRVLQKPVVNRGARKISSDVLYKWCMSLHFKHWIDKLGYR